VPTGRRPGKLDTRAEIVAAARTCFQEAGYDGTSIRAISRLAGVDPALVYHYFPAGKPELFAIAMRFAGDPRRIVGDPRMEAHEGADVVKNFLSYWEGPAAEARGASFVSLAQAMAASPAIADGVRQFLHDRIWSQVEAADPGPGTEIRRVLMTTQLMGLAWLRYVLRAEPMASADADTVAAWFGPIIDSITSRPFEPGDEAAQATASPR
jgi:AcrR family transcriptional regulator